MKRVETLSKTSPQTLAGEDTMSWEAKLTEEAAEGEMDTCHVCEQPVPAQPRDHGYWCYTGNTTPMIIAAGFKQWHWFLGGCTGEEGAALLGQVIEKLEAEPERFQAMNPTNGWGCYSGLLSVLRRMRRACRLYPKAVLEVW